MTSERLADIEARLQRDGRVVAADLARICATSEDTVRRDLRTLAAEGVRRVYGGALPATPARGPVSARMRIAPAAKAALGAALARLVEPGMMVFIDAGSTTLACAERLEVVGVTVGTHAPVIAAALVENEGVRLVPLGGPAGGRGAGWRGAGGDRGDSAQPVAARSLRDRCGSGDYRAFARRRGGEARSRGAGGAGGGGGGHAQVADGGAVLGHGPGGLRRALPRGGDPGRPARRLAVCGPSIIDVACRA